MGCGCNFNGSSSNGRAQTGLRGFDSGYSNVSGEPELTGHMNFKTSRPGGKPKFSGNLLASGSDAGSIFRRIQGMGFKGTYNEFQSALSQSFKALRGGGATPPRDQGVQGRLYVVVGWPECCPLKMRFDIWWA
jgi:hypothetical protein